MALIPVAEPRPAGPPPRGFALWALGFRPFYLLAAAFGAVAVPLWVLALAGRFPLPLPGMWWHAHEMLFGFAAAVIVGFLYTAGRNWTGLPTPSGLPLAALAALWCAGRLGLLFDGGPVAAWVDAAFLPAAAIPLAMVLWRAGSRRNYGVLLILLLLASANALFHLARLGAVVLDPLQALHLALGLVVLLETVIGGRVVPSFTAAALRGVTQWRDVRLDIAAIAAGAAALTGFALAPQAGWVPAVCLLAAALHALRWAGWNPWATRGNPLLWILHLSYAWIPLGLLLLGLSALEVVPRPAGIHALGIGATGGLILGMITRTALGHTGQWLLAGRIETAAYALLHLAALLRVVSAAALPAATVLGVHVAATCWSLALLLYLWRYVPLLFRPRADGRPG